jgi:purine-binding chemotaxis protein CheW
MEGKMSESASAKSAAASNANSEKEQYLSFILGQEEYGVNIQKVQEIKGWDTVTRVPYSPPYVLGVINLRGSIVPVIDLRIRFGLERIPHDATTVIIVVHVPGERGERTVGMVVDAVSDVHDIAAEAIRQPPDALGSVERVFVRGLACLDGKMLILLDVDGLVLASVSGTSKAAA